MNNYIDTSIIIPIYNDSERLKKCLYALINQTYNENNYEIIVVDNNSTENIKDVVNQYKNVKYCFEKKIGSYAARNLGINKSRGEIIGFTDSDCIPQKDWIEIGVREIKNNPKYKVIAGRVELYYKNKNKLNSVEVYDSVHAFPQEYYVKHENFGVTANLFTWKELFNKVGTFNDKLKSGGDYEWGRRVYKNGYKIKYADNLIVQHPANSSFKQLYKKYIRIKEGHILLKRKNNNFKQNKIVKLFIPLEIFKEKIPSLKYKLKYIYTFNILKIFLLWGYLKIKTKNK